MFHHVFLVWNFDLPTFLKIPKLTWEQPLLHLFLCRPIGGVFFVFAFPHGKTWVFCTPENSRVPKSPFRCFFIRVHFSHPSTNWSDFFFGVGGVNLGWCFGLDVFSCFVLGIMRNIVFFHVLLCICGSFHGILLWFWCGWSPVFCSWLVPLPSHPGAPGVLPVDMVFIDPPFHLPRAPHHATPQCLSAQRNLDDLTLRDPTKIGWKMDPNLKMFLSRTVGDSSQLC